MQTVWKQAICIFYCYKSCSCVCCLLYNKIVSIGSNKKMTKEQILMCFEANENENWQTMFD